MEILFIFLLKIADNALGTAKTISLNKEKYWFASAFNAFSTLFYTVAIVRITQSNDMYSIVAICLATFLGTLLPGLIVKGSEKDKLHIFDITADNLYNGKEFADTLRKQNIAVRTYKTYDKNMQKTLACKVYCTSKEESKFVNSLIKPDFKYNVYVPLND